MQMEFCCNLYVPSLSTGLRKWFEVLLFLRLIFSEAPIHLERGDNDFGCPAVLKSGLFPRGEFGRDEILDLRLPLVGEFSSPFDLAVDKQKNALEDLEDSSSQI